MNAVDCKNGQEQFENFYSDVLHKDLEQYDYRTPEGKLLFSTVATSLEIARQRRDKWLEKQA